MTDNNKLFTKYVALPFAVIMGIAVLVNGGGKTTPIPTAAMPTATASAPAPTGDDRAARGIATMMTYSRNCEKVPAAFHRLIDVALERIDPQAFSAATDDVLAFYKSAGPVKWCAINKPVVESAMRAYR